LDILSGGRAILGVGAGWFKKEFELLNAWKRASDRVKATEHAIIKLKSLLNATGDEAVDNSNDGKFPCIQTPHPPIWVGTKRKIMLRVATKHANGWIPTYMEPKEYAQRVEDIESNIAQRGGEFTYCSHYSTKIGRNNHNVITFIESMKNAGCEFMAIYPQGGVDEYLNNLGNLVDILSTFQ
jgi:alkanesulfonate monooxygenase SsuD/methylene tetrahydromethanopterin reductase-like flavin-dependent oxidoreductase (luciferase family)